MKYILVLGLVVSFSTIIFSQPSFAGHQCSKLKSGQAAFFENSKYRGACVVRNVGRYSNSGRMGIGNDKISSIKVGSRAQVRLCKDINFKGSCKTYTKSTPRLGRMNDRTSSAIVSPRKRLTASCRPKANQIAVFENVDYKGACSVLGTGSYRNSSQIGIANDTMSSVLVGRNAAMVAFIDVGFRKIFFYADKNYPYLGGRYSDSMSSLKVVKTR